MARGKSGVRLKGPLFDTARRNAAIVPLKREILEAITGYAHKAVARILKQKIKKPTPIYQDLITVSSVNDDGSWRVTDLGGVVYNHWLEGTGSRNFPVTRFKGYHAFERAYALTEKRAGKLAQAKVGKAVRRLGGTVTTGGDDGGS
jgi:hypothetical protein